MTDTETKARELLKRFVEPACDGTFNVAACQQLIKEASDYLKATEPKHPAKVEFDKWFRSPQEDFLKADRTGELRIAFLAGYKAGMLEATNISCHCETCETPKRIRDAAAKVPEN